MARRRRRKRIENAYRVYLYDEAPRLGCGWRTVQLMRIGHKWAYVRELSTDQRARFPVKTWAGMRPQAHEVR